MEGNILYYYNNITQERKERKKQTEKWEDEECSLVPKLLYE